MSFTNLDFASGLTGWTLTISAGNTTIGTRSNPGVVTSHTSLKNPPSGAATPADTYVPVYGAHLARIGSGSATKDVYQTIKQTATLTAGEIVDGWAALDWDDSSPAYDNARVRILQGASVIATPFTKSGASGESYSNYPWTYWTWTCPADGSYTLEYGICNKYDNADSSWALFCAAAPAFVPEIIDLLYREIPLTVLPKFNQEGKLMIRQMDPLPLTLVNISIEYAGGNLKQ